MKQVRKKIARNNTLRPNRLIVGTTGSGKTTAEVVDLILEAKRGEYAIVACDPHGTLVNGMLPYVAKFFSGRTLIDWFDYNEKTPGWCWLKRPKMTNAVDQAQAEEAIARRFAEILTRRREGRALWETPLIEEWTMAAILLHLRQRADLPASLLACAFEPSHPQFDRYLEFCTDSDLYYKFAALKGMNPRMLGDRIDPARRFVNAVCRSPVFKARDGESFDFYDFLQKKGILLLSGQNGGDLSDDAMRTMFSAIIARTMHTVWKHYGRTGQPLKVILAIDETTNYMLFGLQEALACLQLRKAGLSVDCLVQDLNFGSDEIQDKVFQGFNERHWFRCNHRTAEIGAIDVGLPNVDPKKVLDRRTRRQAVPMGQSKSDLQWCNIRNQYVEHSGQSYEYDTIEDITYMKMTDQIMEARKDLMKQKVGHRTIYDHGEIRHEYVEPLKSPKGIKKRIKKFLRRMRARTCYRKPEIYIPSRETGQHQRKGMRSSKRS